MGLNQGQRNILHISYTAAGLEESIKEDGLGNLKACLVAAVNAFSNERGGDGNLSVEFDAFRIEAVSSPRGEFLVYAVSVPPVDGKKLRGGLLKVIGELHQKFGRDLGALGQEDWLAFRKMVRGALDGLIRSKEPSKGSLDGFWGQLG